MIVPTESQPTDAVGSKEKAPVSPTLVNSATSALPPTDKMHADFVKLSKYQDVGRWYVTKFIQEVAQQLPPNTLLLDAGAGECVYKRYFTHCNYKAVDMAIGEADWNYDHLDYKASLDDLPMDDNTFDAILCTQTLEHVEWPRECVKEMYRVLKPGGTMYLTAPMAHIEHQIPYDFWRYTSYGLRSVFKHAGFDDKNVEVRPFGGTFTRLAYQLPWTLAILPREGIKGKLVKPLRLLLKLNIRIWQALFLHLEKYDTRKIDPFGWAVIARKGGEASHS